MPSVETEFVAKQLLEWLQSGAIVETRADEELAVFPLTVAKNDSIEELARSVGWIRHDLDQAGITVNEEKSEFLPSQSGEESSLHSRFLQQSVAQMEDEGIRTIPLSQHEFDGPPRGQQEKMDCVQERNGGGTIFSGERGAMLDELEEELKKVGRLDLMDTARSAMERSVAPSTLKAYACSDRARRRLASACGLEEEADFSLCLFVLDAMVKRRSKSTVATALAAFGFVSGEDPKESRFGPLLGAALKTAARTVPTTSHEKASRESVEKIIEWGSREGASKADLRIAILSLISFGALLRPSEAVDIKRDSVAVRIGEEDSLLIGVTVPKAKNDQEGKGRTTFLSLNSGSSGRVAWDKYIRTVVSSTSSPFFFPSFTDASKGMTTDFVRKELKRACQEIGIVPLTPHCLRGGGATTSIEEGTPVDQVRMRGRWNSTLGMTPYLADSVKMQGGTLSL